MSSRLAQLKKHKAARITGAVLLSLFVLVLLVQVVLSVMWGRGLEKKLAELRKRGEPTTLAELMPAPVPPEDNAALLYEKAFLSMKGIGGYPMPSPVDRCFSSHVTSEERARLLPELRRIVQENDTALRLAEQAASRQWCVFPVDWTKGMDANASHHWKLYELVNLICTTAVVQAKDGRMNAAVDDLILALKVARAVEQEPVTWSFIQETVSIRRFCGGLRQVGVSRPLSPRQAAALYTAIDQIPLEAAMLRAFKSDWAFTSWVYAKAREDLPGFSNRHIYNGMPYTGSSSLPFSATINSSKGKLVTRLWRPHSYREQLLSLEISDKQQPYLRLPYREIIKRKIRIDPEKSPKSTALVGFAHKLTSSVVISRDYAMAEIGLAQTAMALRTYKDYTGRYPESLEQLKKRINWKLPDDPFSGKPFVYKRLDNGRGFKLYSISWDLKDNGGLTYEQIKPKPKGPNAGDIVWESRN